jgi:D-psicose/D-tagatose/L-ribulose 3-epimerase
MRIGFNLLVVGGFITPDHAPVFERLKALGYDGVEIPVMEGDVAHYERLGRLIRDIGLATTISTIVGEDTNPMSADPAVRARAKERLRWAVECAAALGASVIMGPFHSPLGVFTGAGPTEGELDRLAEALRAMAEHGAQARIRLAIEPLNRFECYALNTMAQASDLKRRVGHDNFGYTYDTFHANIEERDPVGAYLRHAREIAHIHISENDRGIPGRGHVPWRETFSAIRAAGYDGWLTVEAFGRTVPALAAATRVWRDLFPDIDTLFSESITMIRRRWDEAAHSPAPPRSALDPREPP